MADSTKASPKPKAPKAAASPAAAAAEPAAKTAKASKAAPSTTASSPDAKAKPTTPSKTAGATDASTKAKSAKATCTEAPSSSTATPATPSPTVLININAASVEELQKVPGVGDKRAAAIVAYREQHTPAPAPAPATPPPASSEQAAPEAKSKPRKSTVKVFKTVDDLVLVSGISTSTVEAMRPYVTVKGGSKALVPVKHSDSAPALGAASAAAPTSASSSAASSGSSAPKKSSAAASAAPGAGAASSMTTVGAASSSSSSSSPGTPSKAAAKSSKPCTHQCAARRRPLPLTHAPRSIELHPISELLLTHDFRLNNNCTRNCNHLIIIVECKWCCCSSGQAQGYQAHQAQGQGANHHQDRLVERQEPLDQH